MVVECDFLEDVRRYCQVELRKLGIEPDIEKPAHDICVDYFNVLLKMIPKRPRRVHWSSVLVARKLPSDQREAIQQVATEITRGDDLTPRLSKGIFKPERHDPLLADWGIHHLHIGTTIGSDGFVGRANEVLFVRILEEDAYLIDLGAHGVQHWADQQLMEILHAEFPESIEDMLAPGVVPGSLEPAEWEPADRHRLRKKISFGTQVADGTVYLPDAGVSLSGHSVRVIHAAMSTCNHACAVEEYVRAQSEHVAELIEKHRGVRPVDLHLEFLPGTNWGIKEKTLGLVIRPPS